ncbi:ATP-binding cassette domain-containing protein [Butyricicoccus sp.]|uniref:ATP-binding cassette domain-containing protein n=1 Tax=Butyricicoccus sp. TaxID=2049021 RepID=UPI003F191BBF
MSEELLRFMHLELKKGQTIYFSDLNLLARSREIHGIAGLSAEQRNHLLSFFAGTSSFSQGTVYFSGHFCSSVPKLGFQREIFCIGQSSALVEHLTITENLYILQPHVKNLGWINRQKFSEQCEQLFEQFGFQADPDSLVRDLSAFGRIGVELLKAVVLHAKLIIYNRNLDDLSAFEFAQFCSLLQSLSSSGIAVLILCCEPDRMIQSCERVTVIKNGRTIKSFFSSEISSTDITRIINGNHPENQSSSQFSDDQKIILTLRNLRLQNDAPPLSLTARSGDIIGFVDDISAKASQLLESIAGFIPCDRDSLSVQDTLIPVNQIQTAFQSGIFLVKHIGSDATLLMNATVRSNIMLPLLKRSSMFGGMLRKKFLNMESEQAAEAVGISIHELDHPMHPDLILRVQLARIWMSKRPVLLLDNPFAGLKEEDRLFLQQFIMDYAKAGNCVLLSSTHYLALETFCTHLYGTVQETLQ